MKSIPIRITLIAPLVMTLALASEAIAETEIFDGYNLIAPIRETETYLMDNDGVMVHSWSSAYQPGQSVYLLEDSTLLRTAKSGSSFDAGGTGGRVEKIDWESNLLWAFDYNSAEYRQHHDVEALPNGNVLMIAWELKSGSEAIAAGRNPSQLRDGVLWPDHIIEVDPSGSSGGSIVWQWHVWDHVIQDYDASKANYGVVADHPELVDLNFMQTPAADWNHSNSIDYNAELDQIVISVHNFSEIWIIDHSTTTTEAAGHSGGARGIGGDLLYRWGNPQAYGAGGAIDQQLFVQHDAEWIADGLPGAGNILIFNNGRGRTAGDYSTIDEIKPPVLADGSYDSALPYGPSAPSWSYQASPATEFFADHISGSQRLANGNTLICDGPAGRFFEVNSAGETVWEYEFGDEVFRVERFAESYTGLNPDDDTNELSYTIVDTGQNICYGNSDEMSPPSEGNAFFGQDAQYYGHQPSYTLSADGLTVADNNTGLTWVQTADTNDDGTIDTTDKVAWADLPSSIATLNTANYGGFDDWRAPSIKELYSLMDFRGIDPASTDVTGVAPFIDTNYFAFGWGDIAAGERIIDAQYWSSTEYVSTTMNGNATVFGVNFADGRIKGYPRDSVGGSVRTQYIRYVRGNQNYGINDFAAHGDGTVTDSASGLMWQRADSAVGMNWEDALAYAESLDLGGHTDWRLPNAKELQSIVDYARSPDTTNSAAIDSIFSSTVISNETLADDYPAYWTGTTHARSSQVPGKAAAYLGFGRCMGYMNGSWMDVHGAGCQRSDPKEGELSDFTYVPYGYYLGGAPQGDAIRLSNFVRCVRNAPAGAESVMDKMHFVPAAAKAEGSAGAFFVSDLVINNASNMMANFKFVWLPRQDDNTGAAESEVFSLDAGVSTMYADVLGEAFGIEDGAVGSLAIVSDTDMLKLMSRTYNLVADDADCFSGATFGQAIPGYYSMDLIAENNTKRILFLVENDEYRSNLGLLNGTDAAIRIRWTCYAANGTAIDDGFRDLGPYGNTQLNSFLADVAPIVGAYVDVWTETPGGLFAAYASVLDNTTSDPTTVLPQ